MRQDGVLIFGSFAYRRFRVWDGLTDPRRQRGIGRIDAICTNQISIGKVDVAICIHIAEGNVGDMGLEGRGIDAVHRHEQGIGNIDEAIAVHISQDAVRRPLH